MRNKRVILNIYHFLFYSILFLNPSIPAVIAQVSFSDAVLQINDSLVVNDADEITINNSDYAVSQEGTVSYTPSEGLVLIKVNGDAKLVHFRKDGASWQIRPLPLYLSLLPPLIAILLALIFKEVIFSLLLGVFTGAFLANGLYLDLLLLSLVEVVEKYILGALDNRGHLSIILFSLLIGGVVALISRNGGMQGLIMALSRYARSFRSSQFVTWLMGVLIFFDDYANTLIVGNTMRPVTDRYRISREKLAYIVDSTAAPVAAVAFITTWIGAELGYIGDSIADIPYLEENTNAYGLFLSSLKYSFYPLLTLGFILILIYTRRSFGPMYESEKRALEDPHYYKSQVSGGDELSPVQNAPLNLWHGILPILTIIIITVLGLVITGLRLSYDPAMGDNRDLLFIAQNLDADMNFFQKLGYIIGNADSYIALLWGSTAGVVVAILLTLIPRTMTLLKTVDVLFEGIKTMLPAIAILILAWALAFTTEELFTATFLSDLLQDNISPAILPPLVFILSAIISFSTGSSWSTMAILYPLVIPLAWTISISNGLSPDASMQILLNVIATTLAASVLGDHCSPISDTTILSSLASGCDHISHVRTQLLYALIVGVISLVAVTITAFVSGGWLLSLIIMIGGFIVLYAIVQLYGRKLPEKM